MSVSSPAALLALLLPMAASVTAQPLLPDVDACASRIELSAGSGGGAREVCISLELPTTFRFDSPLVSGAVELQDRGRFEDLTPGTRSFTVLPPADIQAGERFRVVVRFADGAAPERATFILVGHPAFGARQVEVFRDKRTVEGLQRENLEERARSWRLGQELERRRAENGPGGIAGLIASGLMTVSKEAPGVVARSLEKEVTQAPGDALLAETVISFRSITTSGEGESQGVRVAVAMRLTNPGVRPWTAREAVLVGKGQEVKPVRVLWQSAPILPGAGESELVVVETELTAREARDTFTLKLWDETGTRLVTLGQVTFP
ncbi:DUF2381 family protein [Archangium lansingense]|uniref:DUF2381 family protein n=1 Tax=Archangium lansingense TaxID=2995310 RepID=UPI003B7A3C2C